MKKSIISLTILIIVIVVELNSCKPPEREALFRSSWNEKVTSYWIGPQYWSNRLQDWQINKGRLECLNGNAPKRTVHLLTREISQKKGDFTIQMDIGKIQTENNMDNDAYAGFMIGAGDTATDYRKRALIHHAATENDGFLAVVSGDGRLHFKYNDEQGTDISIVSASQLKETKFTPDGIVLQLKILQMDTAYRAQLSLLTKEGDEIGVSEIIIKNEQLLLGNIALIANGGADQKGHSFWFKNLELYGKKLSVYEERIFGPVAGILYTINNKTLKINAQLMPIGKMQKQTLKLEVALKGSNNWKTIADKFIDSKSYTVVYTIDEWETEFDFDIRLIYNTLDNNGEINEYSYYGSVPAQPNMCDMVKLAVMHGNSHTINSIMNTRNYNFSEQLLFPHNEIIHSIAEKPVDMLVYTGNQIDGYSPTMPDTRSLETAELDYLYKWYLWQWSYSQLNRKMPAIVITDSKDYYQTKLWGESGKKAPVQPLDSFPHRYKNKEYYWPTDQGGFIMPPDFVKLVEKTQVSHLPKPYDTTFLKNDISPYYTELNFAGISFAILEGRKFKTSPQTALPEQKPINGYPLFWETPDEYLDKEFAKLFGQKQQEFLQQWSKNWNNALIKIAIVQSDFADIASYPDSLHNQFTYPLFYPYEKEARNERREILSKNMLVNAWPQNKRNKTIETLRKCYAFSISGGSNLGRLTHHGIDKTADAIYNFTPPPLVNKVPERWSPPPLPRRKAWNKDLYNRDGFGNKVKVMRLANQKYNNQKTYKPFSAYGIVTIDVCKQNITTDCIAADSNFIEGWPVSFSIWDNYTIRDKYYLPQIEISGTKNPVLIEVFDDRYNTLIHRIRTKYKTIRLRVPHNRKYKIIVSIAENNSLITKNEVRAVKESDKSKLMFNF